MQARFGVASSAMGQLHQDSGADGPLTGWASTRPTKVQGHAFIVQELPLPIASHRSGGLPAAEAHSRCIK